MLKLQDLKRILATAKCLIQDGGIAGLLSAIGERARLERKLFPSWKIKSISLDGCSFDIERLPNLSIRMALLSGEYESFERRAVLQYVQPDLPVIELGGCIGVVACITNKLLHNPKAHVVVEANTEVLPHLNENRARNSSQFEVLNAAICYDQKWVTFAPTMDFHGASLEQKNGRNAVTVKTIRLAEIVSRRNFKSFTLICDIEGYEYGLIQHESEVLRNADTIILETHARMIGGPKTAELLQTLHGLGFKTIQQDEFVYVLKCSAGLT